MKYYNGFLYLRTFAMYRVYYHRIFNENEKDKVLVDTKNLPIKNISSEHFYDEDLNLQPLLKELYDN